MTVHRGLVKLCTVVAADSDISNQYRRKALKNK